MIAEHTAKEPAPFKRLRRATPDTMTEEGRAAIRSLMAIGCTCGAEAASLVKRQNSGGVFVVGLQCDTCGRFNNNGVKRIDHPKWTQYQDHDPGLRDRFWASRTEAYQSIFEERKQEARAALAARRAEYSAWLSLSPEWWAIRQKVIKRCGGICEACLDAPATDVHHTTYHAGKVPPAWLLKGVCRTCHDRMHSETDEWRAAWAIT